MNFGPMRRTQLVNPFGVGALSTLVDGTTVITGGLDHWFDDDDGSLDLQEYIEHDWRLEQRLRISEVRLPPDHRKTAMGSDPRNIRRTIPVFRFPLWSFCMICKSLDKSTLSMATPHKCEKHKDLSFKPKMSQVPFIAICRQGHVDDFPFSEWVHREHAPRCSGPLRLKFGGGDGLEGQVINCDQCSSFRSLRGITSTQMAANGEPSTFLTEQLASAEGPYHCRGARPWLAEMQSFCNEPLRGALVKAGNVYFPVVESSIYIPREAGAISNEMHDLLRIPEVMVAFRTLHSLFGTSVNAESLRRAVTSSLPASRLEHIDDNELLNLFMDFFLGTEDESGTDSTTDSDQLSSDDEWRFQEFQTIRGIVDDDRLQTSDPGVDPDLADLVQTTRAVNVLRETRVLRGFTRIHDEPLTLERGKQLMRRQGLDPVEDWLPGYAVKGEGIFLELNESRLVAWEDNKNVLARVGLLNQHYAFAVQQRDLAPRVVSAREILIHTLSHVLINELIFTCGYSSASLRERLYVSTNSNRSMTGLLIYTAAGDSEGTMGGLVRMAQPEALRQIVRGAILKAGWCSSDPVCMDAGERGQGPDSCNLAACHGCALLPETSCEEFNRFLDRGLLVGTHRSPELGFFQDA